MSATFQVHSHGFSATQRQLLQLADPDFQQELLESVGALVESQTRQRIQEDRTGPDGKAWARVGRSVMAEHAIVVRACYKVKVISDTLSFLAA